MRLSFEASSTELVLSLKERGATHRWHRVFSDVGSAVGCQRGSANITEEPARRILVVIIQGSVLNREKLVGGFDRLVHAKDSAARIDGLQGEPRSIHVYGSLP